MGEKSSAEASGERFRCFGRIAAVAERLDGGKVGGRERERTEEDGFWRKKRRYPLLFFLGTAETLHKMKIVNE